MGRLLCTLFLMLVFDYNRNRVNDLPHSLPSIGLVILNPPDKCIIMVVVARITNVNTIR